MPIAMLRLFRWRWADDETLMAMSDRDLADIGLRRGDFGFVVYRAPDPDTTDPAERPLQKAEYPRRRGHFSARS